MFALKQLCYLNFSQFTEMFIIDIVLNFFNFLIFKNEGRFNFFLSNMDKGSKLLICYLRLIL
jgi:hypothetical protein